MGFPNSIQRYVPEKRFIVNFPPATPNQAAIQTLQVPITAAWNFLEFYLVTANLTISMVQELRLKIGGEVIQRWFGPDLDAALQYDKRPAFGVDGILTIPLRRMGLRSGLDVIDFDKKVFLSGEGRDLAYESSLNCGSAGGGFRAITDVSIELDLINTGAQPGIGVYARVTPPIPGGPGPVYRVDKQSKTVSNGQIVITKAEMGLDALRAFLNRIQLVYFPGGTADNWQLRYGTNDWWTIGEALLIRAQTEDGLRVPQAGMDFLDFQEEGFGDTMLDLTASNSDLLLQFQGTATAGLLTYYLHSLGLPFAPNA